MRTVVLVLLLMPLLFGIALAEKLQPPQIAIPFDGRNIQNDGTGIPIGPRLISASPGDSIGTSFYAYQTNGSTGNRIAIDDAGLIHIAWTKGTEEGGRPRYVYYNVLTPGDPGSWLGETQVSAYNGSGFVTMDLMPDGVALLGYHWADNEDGANPILARDLYPGMGMFDEFHLTAPGEYIWPYIARDTNGRIHMLLGDVNSNNYYYNFSDDDGENWDRMEQVFDSSILSGIICSSPVSPKSAVVYTRPDDVSGYYNVFVLETTDGSDWNWGNPTNITNFVEGDPYSAWADVDAVYDYDDVLHISYQGLYVNGEVIESFGDVMHWSEPTDHSVVATNDVDCFPINYALCICKMSLGIDPANNNVVALWSELSPDDVSAAGYSNGELFAAASVDGGASWFEKVNLTNSPSNNCAPPDCDSDVWSSLAEVVNGTLHIMYVDDDDAGAEWNGEGGWTDNNVLYLAVDEGELIPLGVDYENPDLPFDFALGQNYPNPFNANTVISIDGEIHSGNLAIYDVTGSMVRSFPLSEETRSITWDGTNTSGKTVASGTYFYSVNFDEFGTAAVRKMTLLK